MYLYPYICTMTNSRGMRHTSHGAVALYNYREFVNILEKWNILGSMTNMTGLQYQYKMDMDGIIRRAPFQTYHGDIITFD